MEVKLVESKLTKPLPAAQPHWAEGLSLLSSVAASGAETKRRAVALGPGSGGGWDLPLPLPFPTSVPRLGLGEGLVEGN